MQNKPRSFSVALARPQGQKKAGSQIQSTGAGRKAGYRRDSARGPLSEPHTDHNGQAIRAAGAGIAQPYGRKQVLPHGGRHGLTAVEALHSLEPLGTRQVIGSQRRCRVVS